MQQIERSRRNVSSSHLFSNGSVDGICVGSKEADSSFFSPVLSSSSVSSSSSSSSSVSPSTGVNYIEHRVTRMDTLAGVAIKYGVEVADIKKMNGLVTDLQMFAHKSLQIPLPGRHPPSPILANGSSSNGDQTPRRRPRGDVLELFESLKPKPQEKRVSPAMSSLQGYYGLSAPNSGNPADEGTEMAVYRTSRALFQENRILNRNSPVLDSYPTDPLMSRSCLVNGLPAENGKHTDDIVVTEAGENGETDRLNGENSVRRRQKADTEPPSRSPELLSREESGGPFSGRAGKGASLRPQSVSRIDLDSSYLNAVPFVDSFMANGFITVRRSSSTSNLQESEGGSFIWPKSMWTLKADSIARPYFDGLPKPTAARRNKAALD